MGNRSAIGRLALRVIQESWPIEGDFAISRGRKSTAEVIVAELSDGEQVGRGECVPYARYGESVAGVRATIEACAVDLRAGLTRHDLLTRLPAGAARNALDCALWDLEAKRTGKPIAVIAEVPQPRPRVTVYTVSLAAPEAMAATARNAADRPLLKLKLAGDDRDVERVAAVASAAPQAQIIVDANEAWTQRQLESLLPELVRLKVALIEQPVSAREDGGLVRGRYGVPVCADESAHDRASLEIVRSHYDYVNIKLDKTGGLTEALAMARAAQEYDLGIMVGCMVGTSLGMAPAFLLAPYAHYIDLDGPLLLARDRPHPIRYDGSLMFPPSPLLWG